MMILKERLSQTQRNHEVLSSPSPVTRPLILSMIYSKKITMNEVSKTFHICQTLDLSVLPLFMGKQRTLARYTVLSDVMSSDVV